MLWKKESKKNDSMYIDIFALNGGEANLIGCLRHVRCEETNTTTFNKSDALSLQKRNMGNECFKRGKWISAIETYGESLCYAENGSKNISLAYANRSTCFLKMKLYDECLVDIDLAKAAGYPANLMPKLDRRKKECLKGMDEGAQPIKFEPKLSFEPDTHFPSMANVLKFGADDNGDLVVFAKEDIDVGQIIMVEKTFMGYVYSWHGIKCNICLKMQTNLVPCKKCTVAMFCSGECQGSSIHGYECGVKACKCDVTNNTIMRIVRSFLLAIDMFSSADELMRFVEKTNASDRNQIPATLSVPKSKYEAFLKLPIGSNSNVPKDLSCIIYEVYRLILGISKFQAMFKSEKHRRFLMHLIYQHYQIVDLNSVIEVLKSCSEDEDDNETCDEGSHMDVKWASSETGLMSRYFKHSCAPNVYVTTSHGSMINVTVRPIKKGQQLTRTILLQLLTQSKKKRKQVLWRERKMKCKCVRCNGFTASNLQRDKILDDPDFQYLNEDWPEGPNQFDAAVQARVEKCKCLLRKYGQFPWCVELGEIVEIYIHLILVQQQFNTNDTMTV